MNNQIKAWIVASLLVFIVVGCSGGGGGAGGNGASTGNGDNDSASSNIGPTGGTLTTSSGNVQINIPAGALSANLNITIAPSTANTPPGNIGEVVDFGPDGTIFNSPVSISMKYDPAMIPQGITENDLALAFASDADWIEIPTKLDTVNKILVGQTAHFSAYAPITSISNTQNNCIYPAKCSFPDFTNLGIYLGGEYVYQMDSFNGVTSYLNSKSNACPCFKGDPSGSYYQCTEYVARYLSSIFGTDNTDKKNLNDSDTQGFEGLDFHPNYDGNPPAPTVDKGGQIISLTRVTSPQAGDIALFSYEHSAVVKSVSGTTVTLIEQNFTANNKYTVDRTVSVSASNVYFYRFPNTPLVTYSMSGTIHSESNSGPVLSGATVSIAGMTATTDINGTFSITGIPAGTYAFSVSASGYDTYTNSAYYVGSDQADLDFYLTQPAVTYSMSGTIHSESNSGPALSGATVSIAGMTATTNSSGQFSITGIPAGMYALSVSKSGYDSYSNPIYYIDSNQILLNFYITAASSSPWTGTKQLGVTGKDTRAQGVAVDSSGNVYVAGWTTGGLDGNTLTGTEDFFVTKYDSSGNKVRTKQLGVSGKLTFANSVAVDSNGNVYVAGATTGGLDGNTLMGSTADVFVTKYDSSGNKVRTKQLGVSGKDTNGNRVAVDSSGNVYVAGWTQGGLDGNTLTGTTDFFVTKYDSSGNKVRTKQLGVSGKYTFAFGVAVDSSGNVYVAGATSGGLDGNTLMGIQDFFVTKYDSSGNKVRTKQLGVSGKYTSAPGVAVDANGNVYVAGSTTGGLDGNTLTGTEDFFVTKYDSSGNKIRTKQLGVSGKDTGATGVAVDSNGNVYVAGTTQGGLDGNTLTGTSDFFFTEYDPSGNKVRTQQLGVSGKDTFAFGVAVDSNVNVYVSGSTSGGLDGNTLMGIQDVFVTKYDSSGNKQ